MAKALFTTRAVLLFVCLVGDFQTQGADDPLVLPLNDVCDFWDRNAIYFMGHCYNLFWAEYYDDAKAVCSESYNGAEPAVTDNNEKVVFLSYYKSVQRAWDFSEENAFVGANFVINEDNRYWQWESSGDGAIFDSVVDGDEATECLVLDFTSNQLTPYDCFDSATVLCQIKIVNMCPSKGDHLFYGYCYRLVKNLMTFDEASTECGDGHLAKLENTWEQKLVSYLTIVEGVTSIPAFLGAKGTSKDGPTDDYDLYFTWQESQETYTIEGASLTEHITYQCLVVFNGVITFQNCNIMAYYFCETELPIVRYVAVLSRPFAEYDNDEDLVYVCALEESLEYDKPVIWAYIADTGAESGVATRMITASVTTLAIAFDTSLASGLFLETGIQKATVVIKTVGAVTVQFSYQGEGTSGMHELFTSSLLHPVSDVPSTYYIVTSTAACTSLPVMAGSSDNNPLETNPEKCRCETFIAIVAVDDSGNDDVHTIVTIRFTNNGTGITFTKDEYSVENPSKITLPLKQYEVAIFRSGRDLSGTYITSDERLTVMSGYITKGEDDCQESISYVQVKPVGVAGKEFLTPPTPINPDAENQEGRDRYRVVALTSRTTIVIGREETQLNEHKIVLDLEGDVREFALRNDKAFMISSNDYFMVYKLSILGGVECLSPLIVKDRTLRDPNLFMTQLGSENEVVRLVVFGKNSILEDTQMTVASSGITLTEYLTEMSSKKSYGTNDWQAWAVDFSHSIGDVRLGRDFADSNDVAALWYFSDGSTGFMSEAVSDASTLYVTADEVELLSTNANSNVGGTYIVYYGFDEDEDIESTTSPNIVENTTESFNTTTETTADTTVTTPEPETYTCQPPRVYNLTAEQKDQMSEEVKSELRIDPTSTGAYIRKKESASDERPSSEAVGMFGVVMISMTFTLLILPDAITLTTWLLKKMNVMSQTAPVHPHDSLEDVEA